MGRYLLSPVRRVADEARVDERPVWQFLKQTAGRSTYGSSDQSSSVPILELDVEGRVPHHWSHEVKRGLFGRRGRERGVTWEVGPTARQRANLERYEQEAILTLVVGRPLRTFRSPDQDDHGYIGRTPEQVVDWLARVPR